MQKATILIGVPNSGKSTYAKKLVSENTVMLDKFATHTRDFSRELVANT